MTRRASVVGDSVFSTAGVLAQGLARFAYTAIIGRAFGADLLSAVNVAFAASILLSLAWPTAAGNAAAAYARPGETGVAIRARLQRSVLLSLVPITAAAFILAVVLGGGLLQAVETAALTIAWSGYIYARGLLMGMGRVAAAATWDLISAVLAIGLLAAVVVTRQGHLALLPAIAGYAVFCAAGLVIAHRTRPAAPPIPGGSPSLMRFVGWNSLALIATNGLMQVSMVVAFAFDTPGRAGQYAAALSLATPVSMVSQAVTQALLPRFADWVALPPRERSRNFRRTILVVGGVMALGCLAVALLMPFVLPLFYGEAFSAAVPIAQLLMAGVFGFSISILVVAYLSATGRAHFATLLAGGASLLGLAGMLAIGMVVDGVAGAVWGVSIGMLVSALALTGAALAEGRAKIHQDRVGYDLRGDKRTPREGK